MDENVKQILMDVVATGTLKTVQDTFNEYNFKQDHSYFDYELLKSALRRRQKDIISYLLDIGCRVNIPNKFDFEETPLHLVLQIHGKIERNDCPTKTTNSDLSSEDLKKIIKYMLQNGASIYDKNANGDTPLYAAFKSCRQDYNTIGLAFDVLPRNYNQDNSDDVLHFHIACNIYHKSVEECFPKCGFDLSKTIYLNSEQFNLIGFAPLNYSLDYGKFHFFKSFIKYRDFSLKTNDGSTYLHAIYQKMCIASRKRDKFWLKQALLRLTKNEIFDNSENKDGISHFHICCSSDEVEFVQAFIDDGVDVNKSISMESEYHAGCTALHIAVKGENEKIIQILLKNGADPNKVCKSGETPLHIACKKSKNVMIRKLLLKYKASLTITNTKGLTPLHTFVYNMKMNGIQMFDAEMSKAPWGSTNYQDEAGLSFFHIACMTNDHNRVKEFLDSGANIDSQVHSGKYKGFTALHFAVIYKEKNIVEFLLKRNAKVNVEIDGSKSTPLHLACEYLHYTNFDEDTFMHESRSIQLDIINLLILYGARVDARDWLRMTPLLHTCMAINNCKNLIYSSQEERGEIIEAKDKLREEIGIRLTEMIKILISHKANINARNCSGSSMLHIISRCKNLKVSEKLMEILVTSGVDVNVVNNAGFTPLHVAAKCANINMVIMLLKYNADPNIQSKRSKTPLHLAAEVHAFNSHRSHFARRASNCELIINQLLDYGADININVSHTYLVLLIEDSRQNHMVYSKLVYMIFIHVHKLLALKLPVSEMLRNVLSEYHEIYKSAMPDSIYVRDIENDFHKSCLDELDKMKETKLDNYTSLYDILLKNPHDVANHVKNGSLIEILKDDKNFPLYSYLLRLQYKKGLLRRQIIESAEAALKNVPNINLPDLCYNTIFKYLRNEDISNVRKAIIRESNFKRKLGDNYSNEIEFVSKLKKIFN